MRLFQEFPCVYVLRVIHLANSPAKQPTRTKQKDPRVAILPDTASLACFLLASWLVLCCSLALLRGSQGGHTALTSVKMVEKKKGGAGKKQHQLGAASTSSMHSRSQLTVRSAAKVCKFCLCAPLLCMCARACVCVCGVCASKEGKIKGKATLLFPVGEQLPFIPSLSE